MVCIMLRNRRPPPQLPSRTGDIPRHLGFAGFSMPEVMLTLTVAGVLTAIAVPSMHGMVQAQRAKSFATRFVASLHLARSEAIKRNGRTVVCKSADGMFCTEGGGWDQGWIVFHDNNNNAALDTGEWIVQQHGGAVNGLRLSGNQPVRNYVSYSASGSAKLTSGAFQAGTLTLCPGANAEITAVKIILSGTGRPRLVTGVAPECG